MQLAGDAVGVVQAIFDLDHQSVEAALSNSGDAEFHDLGERSQNLLERAGKNVDATDDKHVVGPAEHAPFEQGKAVFALRVVSRPHDVACAIANHRAAEAAEGCQH